MQVQPKVAILAPPILNVALLNCHNSAFNRKLLFRDLVLTSATVSFLQNHCEIMSKVGVIILLLKLFFSNELSQSFQMSFAFLNDLNILNNKLNRSSFAYFDGSA